jgi:hypothetical protein
MQGARGRGKMYGFTFKEGEGRRLGSKGIGRIGLNIRIEIILMEKFVPEERIDLILKFNSGEI